MAKVATTKGTKILVQIGDGETPEEFASDCLINSERGIAFSADSNDFIVPDCTNPDDPAWKEVIKDGLSAVVTGSGLLHTNSVETWFNWFKSPDTKNVRVVVNVLAAAGGGYWQAAFHLLEFEVTGERGDKAQCSVSLTSHGEVTWTAAV